PTRTAGSLRGSPGVADGGGVEGGGSRRTHPEATRTRRKSPLPKALPHRLARTLDGVIDVRLPVFGGGETRFERGRSKEDAATQTAVIEASEELYVAPARGGEVRHRPGVEEKPPHGAEAAAAAGHAEFPGVTQQPLDQPGGEPFQLRMRPQLAYELELGDPRRHGHRVPRESSSLIDGSGGGDLVHEVSASAVGTDWQSAADHLPQRRQIRCHAVPLLRPPGGDAEAGHDLIEDQQRAVLVGDRPKALEEAVGRRNEAGVSH